MEFSLLVYVLLFASSGSACLGCLPRALAIQHPGTRTAFVVFLTSVAVWCGGYLGYLLGPTPTWQVAMYIVGFSFAFVAVGAWVWFCAEYTGRSIRNTPFRNAALAVFLVFVGLKVTNPLHNLYFTTEWTTQPFPHVAIDHQLLYWIVLGLSYAVILVGFFMVAERLYHTGTDSRPLVVLFGITGIPALVTILSDQIDGLLPLMYEPPGVAVFAVGTLYVYASRFEAIRMTGGTEKPAIYLDQANRIRDYNAAAAAIFPTLPDAVGDPIAVVSETLAEELTDPGVVVDTDDGETRYFEVSTTPFLSGEVQTGQLVTITDVSKRESYRRELEVKSEQLEALNRVVRHDIKNDMTVVLGWAEYLEDHVDEAGKPALERVIRSSEHVVELTETARDFIESLTDDTAADLKPIALQQTVEAEVETVSEVHSDAQFDVRGDLPAVTVQANEMLSSVFRNLLENAVRHNTNETPVVTITGEADDETVQIRVADNGPGVPDDQKEQIFGKGQKGIGSPGSGIGLYLAHTLTEQYGGTVWVEDNEPAGAVFVVELPRRNAEGDEAE